MPTALLSELAAIVEGRVVGDSSVLITSALPIQDAVAGSLTLADNAKHAAKILRGEAAAVLVRRELPDFSKPQLVVEDLHTAFQALVLHFRPAKKIPAPSISASATIDSTAKVGQDAFIGPGVTVAAGCTIGRRCKIHAGVHVMAGTTIGDDVELYPNVVLYEDTLVGSRVVIHSGSVIGAFGFGYASTDAGHTRSAQLGWVEIGDDVEIGANTCVDRGSYGATKLGPGTKLDNLVQIGHNVQLGPHNLICAQVGMAGSTTTGKFVVMAGQVGVGDHLKINDNVTVGAQAGVMHDVESKQVVLGSPAVPRRQKLLEVALQTRLPETRKEIKQLQRQVQELTEQLSRLASTVPTHLDQSAAAQPPTSTQPRTPHFRALQVDSKQLDCA